MLLSTDACSQARTSTPCWVHNRRCGVQWRQTHHSSGACAHHTHAHISCKGCEPTFVCLQRPVVASSIDPCRGGACTREAAVKLTAAQRPPCTRRPPSVIVTMPGAWHTASASPMHIVQPASTMARCTRAYIAVQAPESGYQPATCIGRDLRVATAVCPAVHDPYRPAAP